MDNRGSDGTGCFRMEVRTDIQLIISRAQGKSSYNNSNTNRQSACGNNNDNQFESPLR